MRALCGIACLALMLAGGPVRADEPSSDLDALKVADDAELVPAHASDWRVFLEGGALELWNHPPSSDQSGARLSLDAHYETVVVPGLRFVFADRLDEEVLRASSSPPGPSTRSTINTLKEAYVSWQINADQTLDLGRINLRYGVATGYNPTDFFRADAIRSIVSIDPSSLRENRLGSVVLESQTLWEGSSLTALISPKLATTADPADFSADWGATNGSNRWLLAASHQFTNDLNPQLLVYGKQGSIPQAGLNVSSLLNQATVAFLEWSGGRAPTLLDQALGRTDATGFRNRAALGLTYTTDFNLSITLEHELNSAGADAATLEKIAAHAPLALLEYLGFSQEQQDLPSRRAEFLYASWQDFAVKHLDLTSFIRFDPISHSRTSWLETRYHFDHADLAVQWQLETGRSASVFGAIPTQREVQILLRYFL